MRRERETERQTGNSRTDVLAHLHSVRGRRGRSLYDRCTGRCRRSWHRSGRRRGRKSIHQCLCREKDKLLETLQTVQPITTQETSVRPSRHIFPFSSLVLYCIHCLSWIAMGQITCHNNNKKSGGWWWGFLRGRQFLFLSWYSCWPPGACSFRFQCTEMACFKVFWNNKLPQQEAKELLLSTW